MSIYKRKCQECGKEFDGGPRAWYCPDCRTLYTWKNKYSDIDNSLKETKIIAKMRKRIYNMQRLTEILSGV